MTGHNQDLSAILPTDPDSPASFNGSADDIVTIYATLSVQAQDKMLYDGVGNRVSDEVIRDNSTTPYSSTFYTETLYLRSNGPSGINGRYGYEYDKRGNLIAKGEVYSEPSGSTGPVVVDTTTGDRWDYRWDLLNRLQQVSHDGTSIVSFAYSPRGLRVKKSGIETTYFVYDLSGQLIYQTSGTDYTEYIHAFGQHIARIDGVIQTGSVHVENDAYYYHTDHVGTVHRITDELGAEVWSASYTAFGEVISEAGSLNQAPIFGGKTLDEDIGLYYFNARWYDPETGRFVSEDPVRDGPNWYAYVGNNPLKWVDPTGLIPIDISDSDDVNDAVVDDWFDTGTYSSSSGTGSGSGGYEEDPITSLPMEAWERDLYNGYGCPNVGYSGMPYLSPEYIDTMWPSAGNVEGNAFPDYGTEYSFGLSYTQGSVNHYYPLVEYDTVTGKVEFFGDKTNSTDPGTAYGMGLSFSEVEKVPESFTVNIGLNDYLGVSYTYGNDGKGTRGTGVTLNLGVGLGAPVTVDKPEYEGNHAWGYSRAQR